MSIGKKNLANLQNLTSNHKQYMGKKISNSIYLQPSDEYEIVGIISHFQESKSPGFLDIPVRLIKRAKHLIATNLTQVFNTCLQTGYYPDIFKVVPLHKKGCKSEVGNYRPISILSSINKILEVLLHKRLTDFWELFFVNIQRLR